MIEVSTLHLSVETLHALATKPDHGLVYPKGGWGYFYHVPNTEDSTESAVTEHLPKDLKACISHAREHGAQWIMFDVDGCVHSELLAYEHAHRSLQRLPVLAS